LLVVAAEFPRFVYRRLVQKVAGAVSLVVFVVLALA